ncbi:MAG: hypothetical protein HXX10_02600 [Rhodoplanes sp.]|uniref:HEPN domain-containing protein n=1 Tax=Rhodoplanes sp. TaxID=1968906 RepID=UPI00183A55EE|nr:HEPN domain-containing protein [Rhodoplanes sp.]NVO12904.1 hypothetical protein [Rhodoplanes sp.]
MFEDDAAVLRTALEAVSKDYKRQEMKRTLLGGGPSDGAVATLVTAIERCNAYRAIAGKVLFSGGSGPVIDAHGLAVRLFDKGVHFTDDVEGAVSWLMRLMTTRETTGLLKAAFWGLRVDHDVSLAQSARLTPFDALSDSYMKRKILDRANPCYDGSQWLLQTYYNRPTAALVETLQEFPYIRSDAAAFGVMNNAICRIDEISILLQACCIGHPVAIACWFEYADKELEWAEWENSLTWLLPEINPSVKLAIPVDCDRIVASINSYGRLEGEQRSRLLRSMERFRLSQSRKQEIDRVLDLALAFEIALSDQGDNAPPSWKVSVRTAQLVGGPVALRSQNRQSIASLYELRNQATHGGSLKPRGGKIVDAILQGAFALYVSAIGKLLDLGTKPDWKIVELEPPG